MCGPIQVYLAPLIINHLLVIHFDYGWPFGINHSFELQTANQKIPLLPPATTPFAYTGLRIYGETHMAKFVIEYSDRETVFERLCGRAASLDISPEELIKRFIDTGMNDGDDSLSVTANNLDDFLVANGVLKPAST